MEEKTNNTEASHVPFDSIKSEIPVRKKIPVVESTRKRATRKENAVLLQTLHRTAMDVKKLKLNKKKKKTIKWNPYLVIKEDSQEKS